MAFYSGFFNSKGLDRTYTAEDFTSYLSSIICNGISIPFGWLGSVGNYISVLHDCSGVSADEYYLAWKAVTDNTSPMIRTVKVLEVTT